MSDELCGCGDPEDDHYETKSGLSGCGVRGRGYWEACDCGGYQKAEPPEPHVCQAEPCPACELRKAWIEPMAGAIQAGRVFADLIEREYPKPSTGDTIRINLIRADE